MAELTDDELILMFAEGDQEAFETLFDRHYVSVFNFARAMLGDAASADDVLQETFLAVARTARQYRPRGLFRTWLMRICRNRCLNTLDAQRVRRAVMAQSGLDFLEDAGAATPVQNAERDEWTAAMRRHLSDLPERQREALLLYAFEQMSYQQIADVLDVPIGTVKTLIHRGRATLAEKMERADKERSNAL